MSEKILTGSDWHSMKTLSSTKQYTQLDRARIGNDVGHIMFFWYNIMLYQNAITIFVGIWEGHGWLGNKRRREDTIGFYFNREWGQGGDPPILWEVIVYSARISSDKFFKMDRGCSERLRIVEGEGENNLVRLMVVSLASQSTGL